MVATFYILFFTVIVYVRLDFSITKVPPGHLRAALGLRLSGPPPHPHPPPVAPADPEPWSPASCCCHRGHVMLQGQSVPPGGGCHGEGAGRARALERGTRPGRGWEAIWQREQCADGRGAFRGSGVLNKDLGPAGSVNPQAARGGGTPDSGQLALSHGRAKSRFYDDMPIS